MRRIVLAASILVLVIGCARERPTVVAKVDRIEVTLEEVEKRLPTRKFKTEEEELEAKKSALNKIIENKLFLAAAEDRGDDKTEEFKERLDDLRSDLAIKQMYQDLIVAKYEATEEDAREMWERLGEKVKARVIALHTQEEAEKVLEELKGGADFAELAREHSVDSKSAEKGGSLGYISWDDRPDEFSQAGFALEAEEMSDVVKVGRLYYIIKVEEKVKLERKPFEEEKARLMEQVTMRKRTVAAEDFVDKLKEKAGITIDEEVLTWLTEKVKAQTGEMGGNIPELTDEEKSRIIVRFEGREWSVGEVMDRFGPRIPPLTDIESVREAIEFAVIRELLWLEAKRRGIHATEEVENRVDERREMWLVGDLRQEVSRVETTPTQDEMLAYYNDHKEEHFKDKKYEEVENRVRMMIGTEKRKEQTEEFLDDLREKYQVEIYEESLMAKKEAEEVKEK